MADEQVIPTQQNEYGYATDEVKVSPFTFGLNAANCFLTKFEWIPNGGKDGAEQEALDIVFNINGTDKNYRMFPVVKAFGKDNVEITDRNTPEFKDAMQDFNARITHILHCFQEIDVIKATFSRPMKTFKEFIQLAATILPSNFKEVKLDIFLQYQWQLGNDAKVTYLDIPKKMSYGKWLTRAENKKWEKLVVENPSDSEQKALSYVVYATKEDGTKEIVDRHVFTRNGWFMNSNFAKQQRAEGDDAPAAAVSSTGTAAAGAAATNVW